MPDTHPPVTTYQFQRGEPIPIAIRRLVCEQVDQALWRLALASADRDVAVHEARKCFKKARAALRLVRDELDEEVFRRQNSLYRDASRTLSILRSSAVMAETLDALGERFSDQLEAQAVSDVRGGLLDLHEQTWRTVGSEGLLLRQIAEEIEASRSCLPQLSLQSNDFSLLSQGLRRVYRRGRRTMAATDAEPTTQHFHDWRKRVKYLRYAMRLFVPLWPGPLQALANELDTLSDHLGLEHDLAELRSTLETHPTIVADDDLRRLLFTLIEASRSEQREQARTLGGYIYGESPKAFVQRMAAYWDAWQAASG